MNSDFKIPITDDFLREAYSSNFYEFWDEHTLPILVETGTYLGSGVQNALFRGIKEIHSIEIDPQLYEMNLNFLFWGVKANRGGCRIDEKQSLFILGDDYNVNLYCGDSCEVLPALLTSGFDKRAFFWLDGHVSFPNGLASTKSKIGGNIPIFYELEAIANHHIKTHHIFIDMDNVVCWDNKDKIKKTILAINSEYKFKEVPRFYFDDPEKSSLAISRIKHLVGSETYSNGSGEDKCIEEHCKETTPDSYDKNTVLIAYIESNDS